MVTPEKMFQSNNTPMIRPPSVMLKDFFASLQGSKPTDEMLQTIAEETLLPITEVQLWLEHLNTIFVNRKRGATKAALSRKQRSRGEVNAHTQEAETREVYRCGVCKAVFQEETEEEELWVGCESCDRWFHAVCVNIDLQSVPEEYICQFCKD